MGKGCKAWKTMSDISFPRLLNTYPSNKPLLKFPCYATITPNVKFMLS